MTCRQRINYVVRVEREAVRLALLVCIVEGCRSLVYRNKELCLVHHVEATEGAPHCPNDTPRTGDDSL